MFRGRSTSQNDRPKPSRGEMHNLWTNMWTGTGTISTVDSDTNQPGWEWGDPRE